MDEPIECIDDWGEGACRGPVLYRMPPGANRSFPRCEHHWDIRLAELERIERTYPTNPPSDFDPTYAGERWEED
jgi:hypothetical protein